MAVRGVFFLLLVLVLGLSFSPSPRCGAVLAGDTPAAAATTASGLTPTQRNTAPVERVSAVGGGHGVGGAGGSSGGGLGGGRPGGSNGDTEGYYNGGSRTPAGGTPSLLSDGGKAAAARRHSGASRCTCSGRLPIALAATAAAAMALSSTS